MSIRLLVAASLLAAAACTPAADDSDVARRRPRPDAAVIAADASTTTTGAGVVSCYSQAQPSATCSAPQVCCFSNYSAQHDGACSSGTCAWGTESCDGPEDCASGQHCCSHALWDPEEGLQGYSLACQSSACGAPPYDYELCHPGGACANGLTCVTAYGNVNDLPRTLYVCK